MTVAVTAAVGTQQLAAQDQDTTTAGRIERLEQQVRINDRLREIWQDSVATVLKAQPVISASRDGFSIRSADNAFSLRIRGYVHSDGRYYLNDSLKPATSQFLLRRVRPIFEATVFKIYDVRMMPDFGAGTTVLQDAYIEARFLPGLRLRTGKYKPPVGLERLQSATDIVFAERGLPTNLVPNRDVGFQLSGDLFQGRLSYATALMNGVIDGGVGDGDNNDDKDIAGRVFLSPFRNSTGHILQNLGFGVAATYGNQLGNATTSGLPSYRTAGQQNFFGYRTGVFADGRRTRVSPQAYLYVGRFGFLGEYVKNKERVNLAGAIEHIPIEAWQVVGTFGLFGGSPSFRSINPKKPFEPGVGGWGALELAVRYGRLTVGDEAFPVYADSTTQARQASGLGIGLNWYLNRNVKLVTSYEQTKFKGGAATGNREKENVLFSRVQFSF
jgi:phosphate-selective porin OprO/OprP